MNKQFFKQLPHEAKKPVSVERAHPDMLIIEGVRYQGDMFRMFSLPDADVLYAIVRDEDTVWLTQVRNMDEAKKFFDPPPLSEYRHLPQMGEEHPNLGEGEFEGDENAI